MTRRRTVSTEPRTVRPGIERRIRVPRLGSRTVFLKERDAIIKEFLRSDTYWFAIHRRGPRRTMVGQDPLEMRAVPDAVVPGYLEERILWLALVRIMHFSPETDFDFQSSQQGGRLELGGIASDFLFPYMRIIINVNGPLHELPLQIAKDAEQRGILEAMGFTVYDISTKTIRDEYALEAWLRKTFNLAGTGGSVWDERDMDEAQASEAATIEALLFELNSISASLEAIT